MRKLFLFLFLFSSFCYSEEERNVNLSWLGFLNLPKKIKKEDGLVKVKEPKLWKKWSDESYEINWISKSKREYVEEVVLYKLLEKPRKFDHSKKSRRWIRNSQN